MQPFTNQVFLLRFWLEGGDDWPGAWRFSLEEPHTGTRRGFSDFEALVDFLADQLEAAPEGARGTPGTNP